MPSLRIITKRVGGVLDEIAWGLIQRSIWVIASRILGVLVGFFLTVVVAKFFGKAALGFTTLLTSFTLLFGVLAEFGIGMYLLRDISGQGDNLSRKYLKQLYSKALVIILLLAAVTCMAVGPIFYGMIPELDSNYVGLTLSLAALALVSRIVVNLNTHSLRGLDRIPAFAAMLVGPPLVNLLFVLAIVMTSVSTLPLLVLPVMSYAAALYLVAGVSTFYLFLEISKRSGTIEPTLPGPLEYLHGGFPFLVTTFMSLVVSQGSILVAGVFLSSEDLGLLSVAVKIAALAAFSLASINMVAEPRFAKLKEQGTEKELHSLAKRTTALVFWTTTPILACILLFAPWMVRTFFGPEYLPSVSALQILTAGYLCNSFFGVSNYFLNMTGGHKLLARIVSGSAVLTLVLSLALIPPYGINGAAASMCFGVIFWNLSTLVAVRLRNNIWLFYLPYKKRFSW